MKEASMISPHMKKQIKIVELLSSFDSKDYVHFRKFLSSPYYANSSLFLTLLEHLRKQFKTDGAHNVSFESLHAVLYPDQPFDPGKVRKLAVRMCSLIEKFFSVQNQERHAQNHSVFLLKELNKRYLCGVFEETVHRYEAGRTNMHLSDPIFMMNDLMIQYEVYRFNQSKLEFPSAGDFMKRFEISIELLYMELKLIQINMYLWNRTLMSQRTDARDATVFLKTHKKRIEAIKETYPGIYLEFLLAELLLTGKRNKAASLIDFTRHHVKKIHYGTIDFVFNIVLSHLMHESDDADLSPDSIISYADLIKFGIIQRHKIVPPFTFLFISMMDMQFPRNTSTRTYLEEFITKVNPEIKESIYCISLATLNMAKKEYGKALSLLNSTKRNNYHMYVTANLLEMQIHYELRQTTSLTAKIDAVKHFLSRRKEIPGEYKTSVQQFLHYITKAATARDQKSDVRDLIQELKRERLCMYRSWLLHKATELRGRTP